MLDAFRHRGLMRLFEDDDHSRIFPEYADRLRIILAALDAAEHIEDMDIHTFQLHALNGDLKGFWAVTVRANWRVIFRFSRGKATDLDLVDYH